MGWIQDGLDYIQDPTSFIFSITDPRGNFILERMLQPVQNLLMDTPWFIVLAGLTAIAFVLSGRRPAVTAFLMLAAIGIMGVWEPAMDTASQVLVATAMAVVIGIAIGIWAAESPRVEKVLRPILDTLQTLPQLVYIIPFIYLMPVSLVPGVVASVLYAIPVVIRLVTSGIRSVPPAPVEAAHAFGASRMQVLAKVKVPLARDSDHARREPGDHHGPLGCRHRRTGGLGRARRLGRPRAAAERVRRGRRGLARDPGARHRARPRDPGQRRARVQPRAVQEETTTQQEGQ